VVVGHKLVAVSSRRQLTMNGLLQVVVQHDVGDGTALSANKVVVMMTGHLFGQLVPGMVVVGDDAVDHPGLLQHGQGPIRGALGQ